MCSLRYSINATTHSVTITIRAASTGTAGKLGARPQNPAVTLSRGAGVVAVGRGRAFGRCERTEPRFMCLRGGHIVITSLSRTGTIPLAQGQICYFVAVWAGGWLTTTSPAARRSAASAGLMAPRRSA